MPYLSLPGVDLWYEDTGRSGTPVILLHAASGTTDCWVHQLPTFHHCRLPVHLLRPPHLGPFPSYRIRTPARFCRRRPPRPGGVLGSQPFSPGRHGGRSYTGPGLCPEPPGKGSQPGGGQYHRRGARPGIPGGAAPVATAANPGPARGIARVGPLLPGH